MRRLVAGSALAVLACFGLAPAAVSCGGFFCRQLPVDQAGEKIVFAVNQDEVTAIIQIQYTGSAEEFSWVVPVPSVPTVDVSSDEIFSRLGPPTRTQFRLNYKVDGNCKQRGFLEAFSAVGAGRPAPNFANNTADLAGGVQVVKQEKVGPFDATTLLPDNPEALVNWLKQNNYNIPEAFGKLSSTYIDKKNYFVALKLQQDKGTGDLRPIVLKMKERYPCVPIRLTAIAATQNMPIILWLFGHARAIPTNYLHVNLNEALVDWVGASGPYAGSPQGRLWPAPNYEAVVTQSMKEAGGNGFVTEFATASAVVRDVFSNRYDTARLKSLTDPVAFMRELQLQGFSRSGPMQNLIAKYLPLPKALRDRGYNEVRYWNELAFGPTLMLIQDDLAQWDAAKFASDIEKNFVKPLRDAADLVDRHPYLTRLFTTMSPQDMENKDPLFAFNSKLPAVSNVREAEATVLCSPDVELDEAPYRIKVAAGTTFALSRKREPLPLGAIPAAFRIEQLAEEGDTALLTDNKQSIEQAIAKLPAIVAGGSAGPGCACRAPGIPTVALDTSLADREATGWGLVLGSLLIWRRKRGKRR